jgi:MFS family permease
MSLLVDPIRVDLGITDTQFSIAYSSGFAITLGFASVPAGRLVDRGSRVRVLAIAVAFWSVMTAATGLVTGFVTLLACRMGVALGQAALNPACYALIADRFPPARLGLALGIFGMAPHVGVGIANLVGAGVLAALPQDGVAVPLLGPLRPWQLALLLVGLPGLLAAALLARLEQGASQRVSMRTAPPLPVVVAFLRRNLHSFGLLKLATGFAAMAIYANAAWAATLLGRTHGWSAAEAGGVLGPLFLACGAIGAFVGGAIGDRLHRYRPDGRILAMVLSTLTALPLGASAPLQSEPSLLLALLGGTILFTSMAIAINPAATMAIMPDRMRGVAAALGVLIVNLIGLGCGPLAVAITTDSILGSSDALYLSLAIVVASSLAASTLCAAMCRVSYPASLGLYERELSAPDSLRD